MIEDFEKFKETCNEEAAKARSERGKQLQAKNMGNHRLGSRGYTGKRPVWAKEDAERERLTTRENPSSSAGFVLTSSAGRRATNKALQLLLSSNACRTRYC